MVLTIRKTGLEDYLPGGEANIKCLIVGGPDTGKTRWSSFWPQPLYADCEEGRASIADRQVAYVDIANSADMLEYLKFLKLECSRPRKQRDYRTAVIDTLDSFMRKVKDEWLQANPGSSSFGGYDAWGYLDAKMQMLMTRLLNLDMNVVVLCHYKDKTRTEGTGDQKVEVVERMLQLQGDIKDSAFNDFDLVGRMDTYFESDGEQRVEKRGITFRKTPDWPFLKDRLHVTPKWMEVRFDDSDYTRLFEAVLSRVESLPESVTVGEITPQPDDDEIKGAGATGPLGGGPLPPQDPRDMPLDQLKKDELVKMARGMDSIKDEVKTNLLKAQLIELIEQARKQEAEKVTQAAQQPAEAPQPAEVQPAEATEAPEASPEDAQTDVQKSEELPAGLTRTPSGDVVDTDGGEILTPEQVAERLGGAVVSEESDADTASGAPAALETPPAEQAEAKPEAKPAKVCAVCGKDLADENPDYVKLSWIKFRKLLCNADYQEAKKAS